MSLNEAKMPSLRDKIEERAKELEVKSDKTSEVKPEKGRIKRKEKE